MRGAAGPIAGAVAVVIALGCACGGGGACPAGQRPTSEGTCVPDDCGEGTFGTFAGGDHVFVDGASPGSGGDDEPEEEGTEEAPFRTLAKGIDAAVARADRPTVVVASGTYRERLLLDERHDGLRIEGVCRPDVRVESPDELPAIDLEGGADTRVAVSGMQLGNPSGPAAVVGRGALVLTHVDVDGAVAAGLAAYGADATVDLRDVAVRDVERHEVGSGYGLAVGDGARATGAGVSFTGVAVAAILVDGVGTTLDLVEGAVDGQVGLADPGLQGAGIVVGGGGAAAIRDTELASVWDVGIAVSGPSAVTLDGVTVVGVQPAFTGGVGGDGTGVSGTGGARIDATDLSVHGAALYGVAASGAGTAVDLRESRVVDGVAATGAPEAAGIGLVVTDGAVLTASDLLLQGNRVYGAAASGAGAVLDLSDADVLDTLPGPANGLGGGLLAQDGGSLSAVRVSVAGSTAVGILVDGSAATLSDVDVVGTARGVDRTVATGVAVQRGAALDAADLRIADTEGPGLLLSDAAGACAACTVADNAFAGVVVVSGGDLELADAEVTGTVPDANLAGGVGVLVDGDRSAVQLERAAVAGNAHAAVVVIGDAAVTLRSNVFEGGPASRPVWPAGTGVFASGTTVGGLWLEDNDVRSSGGAGLFLDGGSATLAGNRWADNAIDVVQQLCAEVPPPAGLEQEPVATVELCPPQDRPVELLSFATTYAPLTLE